MVDKLKDYLYGAEFEIKTDNNLFTYLVMMAKLDVIGHQWLADLSEFHFRLNTGQEWEIEMKRSIEKAL